MNTVERKKVSKVGQFGGGDYECTVESEGSVGASKQPSRRKTIGTAGRGGPGAGLPVRTNNSPDLIKEDKPVDACAKEIGGGGKWNRKDVKKRKHMRARR